MFGALLFSLLGACGSASDVPADGSRTDPAPVVSAAPAASSPTVPTVPTMVYGTVQAPDAGAPDGAASDASTTIDDDAGPCSALGTWNLVDTQSSVQGAGTCAGRTMPTAVVTQGAEGTLVWTESEFSVTLQPLGDAGACTFAGTEQYAVPSSTAHAYFKRNVTFHGATLDGFGATFFHDEDAGDAEDNCSFYSSLAGSR